jgi:glycosyltransferase involved in cell wall biosynthesis
VVDNSPDQDAASAFGAGYHDDPFLRYIVEGSPGLSNARNVGLRACETEIICFMDDDAVASTRWLEAMLAAFEDFGPTAVAAGGRVDPIWEVDPPNWFSDAIGCYTSLVDWGGQTRVAAPREWFAGTNIAFRARPLLDHGGFDTNLGRTGGGATLLSNEEIRVLCQLREAGGLAIYVPDASVSHLIERRRLTRQWFRKRVAWQAVSDFMMDPRNSAKRAAQEWDLVLDFFFRLPPSERTIRGLFYDTDDRMLFRQQLLAIELFMLQSLSGFEGVEPAAGPGSALN